MSDEPTERDDVEAVAEALDDLVMSKGIALDEARLDWLTDWIAARIAQARREGAAEASAILDEYLRLGPVDVLAAALRGDA